MLLKVERLEEPVINLTPMVACVSLLIIIFLAMTQFAGGEERYHLINLPTATSAQPLTGLPDEIIINVTREGTILLGRVPQTLEEVEVTLQQAHDRYAEQRVIIRGDQEAQHGMIMAVLDACARAGLTNFGLAARPAME